MWERSYKLHVRRFCAGSGSFWVMWRGAAGFISVRLNPLIRRLRRTFMAAIFSVKSVQGSLGTLLLFQAFTATRFQFTPPFSRTKRMLTLEGAQRERSISQENIMGSAASSSPNICNRRYRGQTCFSIKLKSQRNCNCRLFL